ncbi:penicillin-binding protein activator [Magnetococcales bacterium HHB-1]
MKRHYTKILILTALALLTSCTTPTPPPPSTPSYTPEKTVKPTPPLAQASDLIKKADRLNQRRKPHRARKLYNQIIQQFPQTATATEALVKKALIDLKQGYRKSALAALRTAAQYKSHPFAAIAAQHLFRHYKQQDQLNEAWNYSKTFLGHSAPSEENLYLWQEMLSLYFKNPNHDASKTLLNALQTTAHNKPLSKAIILATTTQDPAHLSDLLKQQSQNAALIPYIYLALGDHARFKGEEFQAVQHWNNALEHIQPGLSGTQDHLTATLQTLTQWAQTAAKGLTEPIKKHPQETKQQRKNPFPTLTEEILRRKNPQEHTKEPSFPVGLFVPLSGPYAPLGEQMVRIVQKALSDYRDVPLKLHIADSAGKKETIIQAVNDFHQKGIQAIIGPIFHEPSRIAAQEAHRNQIALFSLNPHEDILPENRTYNANIFLNALSPTQQAEDIANFAVQQAKKRRLAILAPDTEYGKLTAKAFEERIKTLGAEHASTVFFKKTAVDFSAAIRQLLNESKIDGLQPDPLEPQPDRLPSWVKFDAIFIPSSARTIRLLAPQLRFFSINTPAQVTLLGIPGWNRPALLSQGTDYLRGALFCDTSNKEKKNLLSALKKDWGHKRTPVLLTLLTYDSVAALAQLLREQRLHEIPWKSRISRNIGFYGASGRFAYLPSGKSQRQCTIYKITSQGIEPLPPFPAEQTQNHTTEPSSLF